MTSQILSVIFNYTGENNYDSVKEFYNSINIKLVGNIGATVNVAKGTITFELLHPTEIPMDFVDRKHTYLLDNNYVVRE